MLVSLLGRLGHTTIRLVLFEDSGHWRFAYHTFAIAAGPRYPIATTRQTGKLLAYRLALCSAELQHLSVSFMIAAQGFFDKCIELTGTQWNRLQTLALTSTALTNANTTNPYEAPEGIKTLLRTASAVVARMPRLRLLEVWNGGASLAAVFRYEEADVETGMAKITWRATFALELDPGIKQAWDRGLDRLIFWNWDAAAPEPSIVDGVRSQAHAVQYLGLKCEVARPVSIAEMVIEVDNVWPAGSGP